MIWLQGQRNYSENEWIPPSRWAVLYKVLPPLRTADPTPEKDWGIEDKGENDA